MPFEAFWRRHLSDFRAGPEVPTPARPGGLRAREAGEPPEDRAGALTKGIERLKVSKSIIR